MLSEKPQEGYWMTVWNTNGDIWDKVNAGHLIQTITGMSSYEIVESIDFQLNEWSEHATDYCSKTRCKVDDIFLTIEKHGMTHADIVKLENLSDHKVLDNLEGGFRSSKA